MSKTCETAENAKLIIELLSQIPLLFFLYILTCVHMRNDICRFVRSVLYHIAQNFIPVMEEIFYLGGKFINL